MDPQPDRRNRFEDLAEEVFEPLQRYLRRRIDIDLAEDVLADVMATLWRRLDDIPEGRALPYSYGVARRALSNQRRSRDRHLRLVERLEAEPQTIATADPAELGPDPEIAAALDSLKPEDREVLYLWAWEQLEPREIAQVLDTTVNAATLRLSRARKRLGMHLARQDDGVAGHEEVEGTQEKQ